jgi:hypothetical protein
MLSPETRNKTILVVLLKTIVGTVSFILGVTSAAGCYECGIYDAA